MFPVKKKPMASPFGSKPKSADPESPDPLEADPKPSPFGAKSSPFGAKGFTKPAPAATNDDASGADETAEAPGYESSEQTGATLIKDIEGAGTNLGLDAAQSRSFAADVFTAMAKCLGGGSGASADDAGGPSPFDTGNSGGEYPA